MGDSLLIVRQELRDSFVDKTGAPVFTLDDFGEDAHLLELGFDSLDLAMGLEAVALRFGKDAGDLWNNLVMRMAIEHRAPTPRTIAETLEKMG